jgi:hypothetical protein
MILMIFRFCSHLTAHQFVRFLVRSGSQRKENFIGFLMKYLKMPL